MLPGFEFRFHIFPTSFSPSAKQKNNNIYNSVNDFNESLATALYYKDHCMHTFSSECHCGPVSLVAVGPDYAGGKCLWLARWLMPPHLL